MGRLMSVICLEARTPSFHWAPETLFVLYRTAALRLSDIQGLGWRSPSSEAVPTAGAGVDLQLPMRVLQQSPISNSAS